MTKTAYIRNSVLWAKSSLPEAESLNIMVGSMATGRKAREQQLRAYILIQKQKAESQQGTAWTFETSKYTTRDTSPPNTATLLNYSQIAPPTVDQTFQYMSLQSQFSFKPHSPQMSK